MAFMMNSITDDPGIEMNISFSKDGDFVIGTDRIALPKLPKSYSQGKYSIHVLNAVIKSLNRSLDAGNWSCNVNLSSISKYVQNVSTSTTITLPFEEILRMSYTYIYY